MNDKNLRVKIAMIKAGVRQWQVAKALNISESVLSRRLREELPGTTQDVLIKTIEGLNYEHNND